jgi:hypothetical protein
MKLRRHFQCIGTFSDFIALESGKISAISVSDSGLFLKTKKVVCKINQIGTPQCCGSGSVNPELRIRIRIQIRVISIDKRFKQKFRRKNLIFKIF